MPSNISNTQHTSPGPIELFIQYFNNYFRASPLLQTHEQCISALEKLNTILGIKCLCQYHGFQNNDQTIRFEKQEYPKLMGISYQLLKQYYNFIDPELLPQEVDLQVKKAKTAYILQFLQYVRQKLVSLNPEQFQNMSLLRIGWTVTLKSDIKTIKSMNLDVNPATVLVDTLKDLRWHYFEEEQDWQDENNLIEQLDQLIQRIQIHLTQSASALSILFDNGAGFLDTLNRILSDMNMSQIILNVPSEAILGCEQLIPDDLLIKISVLAQTYFQTQKIFYGTNSFAVICEFSGQICVQYQNSVKFFISSLIKEAAEVSLLKTVTFNRKEHMYGLLIYMLSGCVFNMSEAEFYNNIVILLDDLTKVINLVFIKDRNVYKQSLSRTHHAVTVAHKKKNKLFATCARQTEMGTPMPEFGMDVDRNGNQKEFSELRNTVLKHDNDVRNFYQAVNLLSSYLQPYMNDSLNAQVECEFQTRDADLRAFLAQLGGIEVVYQTILKLYLQLKSIMKKEAFSGVFEGISALIRNVQTFNSGFGQLAGVITDHVFQTKMESGILGVQQLLKLIDKQLNFVLVSGTLTEKLVVEVENVRETDRIKQDVENLSQVDENQEQIGLQTQNDKQAIQNSEKQEFTNSRPVNQMEQAKYIEPEPINEVLIDKEYRQSQFTKQLAQSVNSGTKIDEMSLRTNKQTDESLQDNHYLF